MHYELRVNFSPPNSKNWVAYPGFSKLLLPRGKHMDTRVAFQAGGKAVFGVYMYTCTTDMRRLRFLRQPFSCPRCRWLYTRNSLLHQHIANRKSLKHHRHDASTTTHSVQQHLTRLFSTNTGKQTAQYKTCITSTLRLYSTPTQQVHCHLKHSFTWIKSVHYTL